MVRLGVPEVFRTRFLNRRSALVLVAFIMAFVAGGGIAAASGSYWAVGQLGWDNSWSANNFWCDPGYSPIYYYEGLNTGDDNAASWIVCGVNTYPNITNSWPSDAMNWNQNKDSGTGGFSCAPSYSLAGYHIETGGSNNSNWYACVQ